MARLGSQSLFTSTIVWALLRRHCTAGSEMSVRLAVWIAVAFFVWAILGGFSLAFGTFPAACLLLAAVRLVPRSTREPRAS